MCDPLPPRIAELSPDEEDRGFRLALGGLEESQFARQIAMLRASVQRQPFSGYRLWGVFRAEELTGSILVQTQPGRTAMVWPPRLAPGEAPETAGLLLRAALEYLPRQQIRMVQALLPAGVGADAELLEAAGLRHVSDLLYLVCLADEFPVTPPCAELQFQPYSLVLHERFARLVDGTYEDSLDCPAVNGVRCVDDVLRGYQATGCFDPERWFVVHHQGEEIGCLVLTDYVEHSTWELIYMGLLPVARGQGWGGEIVRHAQWLCGQALRKRLVLAVDAANEPALRMYATCGFKAWDQTSVFIRVLEEQGPIS
jgi:mycothiol synthase